MPREPSSPDPLQDLDGPSIYGGTPAPRAIKRTSSTVISPHKGKKLSHTTVVSTPTRSPWRIRVVVEAERDSGGEEGEALVKRSRTTRTKTTKVPLRGLSPSPLVGGEEVVARAKRKATPVRRRRRSTTATPGGPGKTPARSGRGKSATPVLEEEGRVDIDEGIGSMMDGNGVLEEEENGDGDDVAAVAVQTHPKTKTTPRKTPRKAPSKTPRKLTRKKPPTVASSSKAPLPPLELESPPPDTPDTRSALSPVTSNRMLSPTPSPRKRRSPSKTAPPPRPSLMDLGPSSQASNDDDMEGFSMVDTGSLLPDFLNSLSQHQDQSQHQENNEEDENEEEGMGLPDFTFMSGGTSYTPNVNKKHGPPPAEQEELFEDDPVGTESFYGASHPAAATFRSSPPPAVFGRLAGKKPKVTPEVRPLRLQPQPKPVFPQPQNAAEGEKPAASSSRKRKRDTPDLDSTLLASEGLRSSMGMEDSPKSGRRMSMSMTSERFGGELDGEEMERDGSMWDDGVEDDTDVDEVPVSLAVESGAVGDESTSPEPSPAKVDRKGKGKAIEDSRRKSTSHTTPAQLAPPRATFATEEEEIRWALTSPEKSPEKSVRFLGHENSRNSPSISYNTSIQAPGERTRLLEASWAAERAAVSAKAREVGALTINDDEIEEDSIEAERIVEDIWAAEAEPRSEATPPKMGKGERTRLLEEEWREEREEVKRQAVEVGAVMINDTVEEEEEEEEGEEEEDEDEYGAAPGGTTTLLNQDTEAFEQSLFQREQLQVPPVGALFTSSSTPYKRGSSLSDGGQTASSKSSPPPPTTSAKTPTSWWRSARTRGLGASTTSASVSASASTSMEPPAKAVTAKAAPAKTTMAATPTAATTTTATTTITTKTATGATTAKERREARARQRAEAAAAARAALMAPPPPPPPPPPPVEEVPEDESLNMLPNDLLTPPLSFTNAPAFPQMATPPTTNTTNSTVPIDSPTPIGPAWEKRHWRLLEKILHSSKTIPPSGSRLTYSVSIDDPGALDEDPDALLADPELNVSTMESGEMALVLGAKEVEAVRRFRERMRKEGSEREQWGVEEVAAKVGALVLAGVRRRRRAERDERARVEKGKGRGRVERVDKGKAVDRGGAVEEVVGKATDKGKGKYGAAGRAERMAERAEKRRRVESARVGDRLSDWL